MSGWIIVDSKGKMNYSIKRTEQILVGEFDQEDTNELVENIRTVIAGFQEMIRNNLKAHE